MINFKKFFFGLSSGCLDKKAQMAILELKKEVRHNLNFIFNEIKKDKSEINKEILKSALKSIIRFSPKASIVNHAIHKEFNPNFYTTLPYVVIHLKEDKAELKDYSWHDDYVAGTGKSYTTWITLPIDEPLLMLRFVPFSHLLPRPIKAVTRRFTRFLNFISASIYPKNFIFYSWSSKLLHSGVLNADLDARVNIVSRVSSLPFVYERCKKIKDIVLDQKGDQVCIKELCDELKKIVHKIVAIEKINNTEMQKLIKSLKNLKKNHFYAKHISHALSILGQRVKIKKESMFFIDFASLYLHSDNFVSFARQVQHKNLIKKNLSLKVIDSYQIGFLDKKNNFKDREILEF